MIRRKFEDAQEEKARLAAEAAQLDSMSQMRAKMKEKAWHDARQLRKFLEAGDEARRKLARVNALRRTEGSSSCPPLAHYPGYGPGGYGDDDAGLRNVAPRLLDPGHHQAIMEHTRRMARTKNTLRSETVGSMINPGATMIVAEAGPASVLQDARAELQLQWMRETGRRLKRNHPDHRCRKARLRAGPFQLTGTQSYQDLKQSSDRYQSHRVYTHKGQWKTAVTIPAARNTMDRTDVKLPLLCAANTRLTKQGRKLRKAPKGHKRILEAAITLDGLPPDDRHRPGMWLDMDHPVVQQNMGMALQPEAANRGGQGKARRSEPGVLVGSPSLGQTHSELWPPPGSEAPKMAARDSLPGASPPPEPTFTGERNTGHEGRLLETPTESPAVYPEPEPNLPPGPSPLLRACQGINFSDVARDAHEGPGAWKSRSRQQSRADNPIAEDMTIGKFELAAAVAGISQER